MLNYSRLLWRYAKSMAVWILHGSPIRSKKEILRIYQICKQCPFFKKDGFQFYQDRDACGICGCALHSESQLFNKIAHKTTVCPDNPPRW